MGLVSEATIWVSPGWADPVTTAAAPDKSRCTTEAANRRATARAEASRSSRVKTGAGVVGGVVVELGGAEVEGAGVVVSGAARGGEKLEGGAGVEGGCEWLMFGEGVTPAGGELAGGCTRGVAPAAPEVLGDPAGPVVEGRSGVSAEAGSSFRSEVEEEDPGSDGPLGTPPVPSRTGPGPDEESSE
jgi:hypothetical protein